MGRASALRGLPLSGLGALVLTGALAHAAAAPLTWKAVTRSPATAPPSSAPDAALTTRCGAADGALVELAQRNVAEQLAGRALFPADELAFGLRAVGAPHVWPRGWGLTGSALDESDVARRVGAWAAASATVGVRRCGVARGTGTDGQMAVSAVAVDALADLEPLPITTPVGKWLTLDARMLVPASSASVVLLGPTGPPKTVLSSLSRGHVRSRFVIDRAGRWLVQVLATVATGPRPVLEALVFAGMPPPARFTRAPAPGEQAAEGAMDDADAIFKMVNAARATEGVGLVVRDPTLDGLARAHSVEMMRARTIGHDVGSGDPAARVQAAGLALRATGENVSSASSLVNAHRALWESPSHRGNLLLDRFSRVGIGVVRDAKNTVWVTQLFGG